MKPSDQEKLLKELLPDERLANFREASLKHGLASLQRHRRQRFFFRIGALAMVACFLAFGLLLENRPTTHNNIAAVSSHVPAPDTNHVKFINDDELLAMFPQGSVALIGKPGQQRLVFLDQRRTETPQDTTTRN